MATPPSMQTLSLAISRGTSLPGTITSARHGRTDTAIITTPGGLAVNGRSNTVLVVGLFRRCLLLLPLGTQFVPVLLTLYQLALETPLD